MDAHAAKVEQSVVPPTVETATDLSSDLSPSEISINAWDQQSHFNSVYANGGAADEHQMMNHQIQQPILHQEYYPGKTLKSLSSALPFGTRLKTGLGSLDVLSRCAECQTSTNDELGQELPPGYGDFEGLAHFDDSGLPLGWASNSYFQPPDTGEDYVDPQLQETISISI